MWLPERDFGFGREFGN